MCLFFFMTEGDPGKANAMGVCVCVCVYVCVYVCVV